MSSKSEKGEITVKAVLKRAGEIRDAGSRQIQKDPWASPYMPKASTMERLSRSLGPQGALDHMENRLAVYREKDRVAREESERCLARHKRRQGDHRKRVAQQRALSSLPDRARQVLADARTVSDAPTARLDGDRVHGGESVPMLRPNGDLHGRCVELLKQAIVRCEGLVDGAKMRDMENAA